MSATQIANAIEYLPDRTQAALERMEHAGQVVRNEGGRWAIGLSAAPQTNGHATGASNGEFHAQSTSSAAHANSSKSHPYTRQTERQWGYATETLHPTDGPARECCR